MHIFPRLVWISYIIRHFNVQCGHIKTHAESIRRQRVFRAVVGAPFVKITAVLCSSFRLHIYVERKTSIASTCIHCTFELCQNKNENIAL